jgi:hypothetical protein
MAGPGDWIDMQAETFTPRIEANVIDADGISTLCDRLIPTWDPPRALADSNGNRVYPACARCAAIQAMRLAAATTSEEE